MSEENNEVVQPEVAPEQAENAAPEAAEGAESTEAQNVSPETAGGSTEEEPAAPGDAPAENLDQ